MALGQLTEAYELLCDAAKRRAYDAALAASRRGAATRTSERRGGVEP